MKTAVPAARPQRGIGPRLLRLFPFLNWSRPSAASLKRDAWAGITVGLVLIPQAVAYATLAGMPPQTGLYAALLPCVVGALWGSSALLAVGPVALTSLLVYGSLTPMATPDTSVWIGLAIWLSLYAGAIQFLLGAFRLGKIANLVSQPVITGFMNAAAIIIIVSQLPALLGIPDLLSGDFAAIAQHLRAAPGTALLTTAYGVAALLLLALLRRFAPKFPGMLLVTVLGVLCSWLMDFSAHGGLIVGWIAAGLPPLSWPPAISFEQHRELLPAALIVALISFTEAMSSCRILARKQQARWDENQELIGQGLAKIAGGFSGTFPVSGSISRSALNLYAGATSPWATLFTTLCVLLSVLFLTDLLYYLPRTVLAAMIIVPVTGLLDFGALRRLFAISRDDGMVAAVTFVVTLLSVPRLYWGVIAGMGLTMVSYLYRHTHPRIIEVALHEDGTLRDRRRFDLPPLAPDLLAVRIDAALNFLTGAALERFVVDHSGPQVRRVLLCVGSVNDIDATGVDTLEALRQTLRTRGIELYLSNIKKQVWDVLESAGVIAGLGAGRIFSTDREAVDAVRS